MATASRNVHKIEARTYDHVSTVENTTRKRRVAAYVRVSTDSSEQLTSYEAQVDFYTRHIKSNPDWEFVSVYTDEGISGTDTKGRTGFNQMIADALNGKIDLILTKSISRFARNTVDTLTTIRKLKEQKIEVYFEKENIYTLDAKGEVMLTIMSSLAQEESRSISENVTWGIRKNMADGKIVLAYKYFLGYEKGEDGLPKIVEEEAAIVREIYQLFLEGCTIRKIADTLTKRGIPTPRGKKQWSVTTVKSILTNEKYKGDALLQKTYTTDFLTKKVKKNDGEIPQYYIQNSHPAIIDPETFDLVQEEMKRRYPDRHKLHRASPFCTKLVCEDCGGYYGRKVWHSNSKYKKYIWQCNHKYDNDFACNTPTLSEEEIKDAFLEAVKSVWKDKHCFMLRLEKRMQKLSDTSKLERELEAAQNRYSEILNKQRLYMEENTRIIQDQAEYNRRFLEMEKEANAAEERTHQLEQQILEQSGKAGRLRQCLEILEKYKGSVEKFEENLWNTLVESVIVSHTAQNKILTFHFYDGANIPVNLPEKKTESVKQIYTEIPKTKA